RSDVQTVGIVKRIRVGRQRKLRVVVAGFALSWRIEDRETERVHNLVELRQFVRREGRLLQKKRGDAILLDDGESIRERPPAGGASCMRQRHKPQSIEHPAGDAEDAPVAEMVEVVVESFFCVE